MQEALLQRLVEERKLAMVYEERMNEAERIHKSNKFTIYD
jgi:hypothetical protein